MNPATGETIAQIRPCSADDYEHIVQESIAAFEQWRLVPAPKRGELVRLLGASLREHKDLLGSLVSLEVGKIKAEGDGEVQEMIDMADFAVGQSRMLYGTTMHSERAQHRMSEQWHPLGPVGVITAFNFPVAVWAWNAFLAAIAGDTVVWKPSPKAPLCAIAVQHLCNRVMEQQGYRGIFSLIVTAEKTIAETLVQDRRLPLISFTGSVPVGRAVAIDRRAKAGANAVGTEREQRDHRGSDGGPLLGDSRHRVRRGRHRRPTLHDDQTAVRPRVSLR